MHSLLRDLHLLTALSGLCAYTHSVAHGFRFRLCRLSIATSSTSYLVPTLLVVSGPPGDLVFQLASYGRIN